MHGCTYRIVCRRFLSKVFGRMSLTSTFAAISAAAFGGGVLSSQFLQNNNCLCDCSGGDQAAPLLDLVKSQLDRCGPEQLVGAASTTPTEAAPARSFVALAVCLIAGVIFFVALLVRLPRKSGLLELTGKLPRTVDASTAPRWRPSGRSSAREL